MIVLKFEKEIKGSCTEAKHKDQIVVDNISFSSSRYVQLNDGERQMGVAAVSQIMLTKRIDISSPDLWIQATVGASLGKAVVHSMHAVGSGDQPATYMTLTLADAVISHYGVEIMADGSRECIYISYSAMEYEYVQYDNSTKIGESKKSYDLLKRKVG